MKSARLLTLLILIPCLVACVLGGTPLPQLPPTVAPTIQQVRAVATGLPGVLLNAGFEGNTYQPPGSMALVLPENWEFSWLDNAYGPRRRAGVVKSLKPECLVITTVPPYILPNPPRIFEGNKSVTCFKLYGTVTYWMVQRVPAIPGHYYKVTASAHAWALDENDPFDAHKSTGIGTGGYYAEEDTPGLTDYQINWRLMVGLDPYGSKDPLGSQVVWGKGAHVYNVFHALPPAIVMAKADSIAVFGQGDNLWGLKNSNSYWDSFVLTDLGVQDTSTATPTSTIVPGPTSTSTPVPGVNYVVKVNLLPQDVTRAEEQCVLGLVYDDRQTVLQSADDAKRLVQPGLPESEVIVWGGQARWPGGNIYTYLGTQVRARSFSECP